MQKDAKDRGSVVRYVRMPLSLDEAVSEWRRAFEKRSGVELSECAAIRRLIELGIALGRRRDIRT